MTTRETLFYGVVHPFRSIVYNTMLLRRVAIMSEKEQLIQARQAMRTGDMQRAREILRQVDHPKAKEWLGLLPVAPLVQGWSRNGIAVVALAFALLLILIGAGAFLAGREAMKNEIAAAFAGAFSPVPAGSEAAPISITAVPAGDVLTTDYYAVRVLRVERPTTLAVSSTFGDAYEVAAGAELIGVQLEFICPTTEVTCYTFSAEPGMLLKDGRSVYGLSLSIAFVAEANDEKIIGGTSRNIWRVFEVPIGTELDGLAIEGKFATLPTD